MDSEEQAGKIIEFFRLHPKSVSVKETERTSGKGQKYLILLNLIVIEWLYSNNVFIGQYVKKWKMLIYLFTEEPGVASYNLIFT